MVRGTFRKPADMTDRIHISKAKGLNLEGIRHSKEGFIALFTPFLEHNKARDIQVVRTIGGGRLVFCHVYQTLGTGEAQGGKAGTTLTRALGC